MTNSRRLGRLCALPAIVIILALLPLLTSCVRIVNYGPEPGSAAFEPENVFDEICACFAVSAHSADEGAFSADDIEGMRIERKERGWTGTMHCSGRYSACFPSSTAFVGSSMIEVEYSKHASFGSPLIPHLYLEFEAELVDGERVKVYMWYHPMDEKKPMEIEVYDSRSLEPLSDRITSEQVLDAIRLTLLSDYFGSRSDSLFTKENIGRITLLGPTTGPDGSERVSRDNSKDGKRA